MTETGACLRIGLTSGCMFQLLISNNIVLSVYFVSLNIDFTLPYLLSGHIAELHTKRDLLHQGYQTIFTHIQVDFLLN